MKLGNLGMDVYDSFIRTAASCWGHAETAVHLAMLSSTSKEY